MRQYRTSITLICLLLLLNFSAQAQSEISIQRVDGTFGWLKRPYTPAYVPPISLNNSSRLESLVRAGNLYLSAQDVVALAIENNIDVEVQRYTPLLAQEVLQRAQAGGALRSVGLGIAAGPQSVSLQGVSVTSTPTTLSGGAGVSSGGGIVTQLGPPIPSLDPVLFFVENFQHTTVPQNNTVVTGTTGLVLGTRTFESQYSQNWDFGLSGVLTYQSVRTSINSPLYNLNPYTTGFLDLQMTQSLLQGFGRAVNDRNIRVQKNNVKVSDLQFKLQVITTVSAALNLYWDLISFREDVLARQREVEAARQLLEDNRKQVQIGALAEIEITRAESQFYTAQQDLTVSQTNLTQQETVLKNALSRNGAASPTLAEVHVIPLDAIPVPQAEPARNIEELVQQAMQNRVELQQGRLNIQSNEMNLVGIRNSLKPTLQAFAELTNNGLTGDLAPAGLGQPGIGYLVGGYGNLAAQIFRRNFPSYSAGFSLSITLRNRAAQSDYATSMLELRQNQLNLQKNMNQVRVDVQNAMIGLRQARVRYEAALKARQLQQQTLDADQKKLGLGATTPYQVIQDQRDMATAVSSEVQSMANYSHARIALEQALGTTLEDHGVTLTEALSGHVSRKSELPANLPPATPETPQAVQP